jgi:DNA invertase Pin-like site-specific DNA recombinase
MRVIAYYRVSTDRQGRSGLGLDAQREAVNGYVRQHQHVIVTEYIEVESGRKKRRPELEKALAHCRRERTHLLIAKLDRLGRNVAFISNLMDSKVEFKAVDNPYAEKFMLHILAAFAEREAEQISTRTKEALAAAKRRGVIMGKNGHVLGKKNKETADQFAEQMRPIIDALKAGGFKTVRAIRDELNSQAIPTYRNKGQKWHIPNVYALLKRLGSGKYSENNT